LSENQATFSDGMARPKSNKSLDAKLLQRVRRRGRGSVCTPPEFLDLGTRAAVDQALSRLVRQGVLRRVSRGVYGYPEQNHLLGELSPRPEEVAKALARRGAQKLQPSRGFCCQPARTFRAGPSADRIPYRWPITPSDDSAIIRDLKADNASPTGYGWAR
jgi:hypothetical protein